MKNIYVPVERYGIGILMPRKIFTRNLPAVILLFLVVNAAALASLQDGLIAYWPLNEASGSTVSDTFGGHDGTLQNGATRISGKLGGAIDTNDSGYVVIPEHADLRPSSALSIQVWVSLNAYSLWDGIVGNVQDNGANESGYCIYTSASGLDCYISVGSSFSVVSSSPSPGQWAHVIVTFDGSNIKMYLNGLLVDTTSASGSINWTYTPLDMNFGRYHDDNEEYFADALIDEVALWGRALDQSEVTSLYNGGNGTPVTGGVYVNITESDADTTVTEGAPADTYEIVLNSEPSDNVQITATPGDSQIDIGEGTGVAKVLTFTVTGPGKWDLPQTIYVTAYDDDVYEGKTPHKTTITHTANGGGYTGISITSVEVDVIDNEQTCGDWGHFIADINKDCFVNILDLRMFAAEWLN